MISAAQKTTLGTHVSLGHVVLTGNPNCGKTTLFNALTGLRAKVGNYAGVTVERKEGKILGSPKERPILALDLPGTYSLSPQSLDEQISRDALFHRLPELPPPGLVVVVVDAANLERNLYYTTQVIELGYPTLIALNMIDVAAQNGHDVDPARLSQALRVPVFPMTASTGDGVQKLRERILDLALPGADKPPPALFCDLSPLLREEVDALASLLGRDRGERSAAAPAEALLLLSDERALDKSASHYGPEVHRAIGDARRRLAAAGEDCAAGVIESRYTRIGAICQDVVQEKFVYQETFSDRLDRIVTHKV
ncbi:MAG: FeoB small GTPase domain-containing protein [Verrucomicrobiota bacterium]